MEAGSAALLEAGSLLAVEDQATHKGKGSGGRGPGLRGLRPGPSRKQQAFRAQAWFDCQKEGLKAGLSGLWRASRAEAGLKARPRRVSQVRHEARALGGVRD